MGCAASVPSGKHIKEERSSNVSPLPTHINGPIYNQCSSPIPLEEHVDMENIANLSTHSISIEKETENDETSELVEWNVIDFLCMLEDEEKKKMKLTEKEFQLRIDGIFRCLTETITNIHRSKTLVNEEKKWSDLCYNFSMIATILGNIPNICSLKVDDAKKYREEAGRQLSGTETTSLMCKVVTDGWKTFSKQKGNSTVQPPSDAMLEALFSLWNSSDCSHEVTYCITGDPYFLDTLKNILTAYLPTRVEGKEMTEGEGNLVESSLSIIHNLSNVDENITALRDLHFVSILSPYLKSEITSDRFKTLAALANMIDEDESEILQEKDDLFEIFMKLLGNALEDPTHRCSVEFGRWSAWECTLAIHRLARNHRNKRLLVEMGCLPHLVKLAKIGTIEETREAVGAIWYLVFDKINQKKILEDMELNVVDLLLDIIAKCGDNATKEAAYGTLRLLVEELQKNEELTDKLNSYANVNRLLAVVKRESSINLADSKHKKGRIMISYSWSNQKELIKIKDRLELNKYFVWMDINHMHGSTLQSMGEAVEKADVVLICMSKKYNESKNCQLEAEYAYQMQKEMVPLKMEADFKPYGWLGIWAGVKLYYDFSGEYDFDVTFKGLLNGLAKFADDKSSEPQDNEDQTDAAPEPATPTQLAHPVQSTSLADIRNWSKEMVDTWLEENNLSKKEFGYLTGKDIAALARMKVEAAEYFYGYLERKIKIKSLSTLDTFINALEHL